MKKIFSFVAVVTMLAGASSEADAKGPGGLGGGGGGASGFSSGHSLGEPGHSFRESGPVTGTHGASGYAPGYPLRSTSPTPPVTGSPGSGTTPGTPIVQ
jgi:hypothetical protein